MDGIVGLSGDATSHAEGGVNVLHRLARTEAVLTKVLEKESVFRDPLDRKDEVVCEIESIL